MDYRQAVRFHEAAKAYGSILGLNSIRALLQELGDIWKELKAVHIAGTNGKGSVCCFLASALTGAGYLTGQFNSPAVFGLRDAYRINGVCISEEEYAGCMEAVAWACRRMTKRGMRHPTVFEVETALAFVWFYRRECEIVVLETGMGGSTDATNLITDPLCSVFTSIGIDHTAFLGNTLEEITAVKAGIIKKGRPVISTVQAPAAERMLKQYASLQNAPFSTAEQMKEIQIGQGTLGCVHPRLGRLTLSMAGSYQAENAALAAAVLFSLRTYGYSLTEDDIRKGLEAAVWPGRFECICKRPLFYIDGAHNPDAAARLKESLLAHFPDRRRIGIMGVLADKPYGELLEILLPLFEKIYTVTPKNPRALPAEALAAEIKKRGTPACVAQSVSEACEKALEQGRDDVITAFGSLFYLDEVKKEIKKKGGDIA